MVFIVAKDSHGSIHRVNTAHIVNYYNAARDNSFTVFEMSTGKTLPLIINTKEVDQCLRGTGGGKFLNSVKDAETTEK